MLGIVCGCAQPPSSGMSQGRYGLYGELFFFLLKEKPVVIRELVRFGPSIPVEAVKAFALVGVAHDGRGEFLAVGQWLLGFVEQLE